MIHTRSYSFISLEAINKCILQRPIITIVSIRTQKRDEIQHTCTHCRTQCTIEDANRLIVHRMCLKILIWFVQAGVYGELLAHKTWITLNQLLRVIDRYEHFFLIPRCLVGCYFNLVENTIMNHTTTVLSIVNLYYNILLDLKTKLKQKNTFQSFRNIINKKKKKRVVVF